MQKCYAAQHQGNQCPLVITHSEVEIQKVRSIHIIMASTSSKTKTGTTKILEQVKGLTHGAITIIEELEIMLNPKPDPTRKENIAAARKQLKEIYK